MKKTSIKVFGVCAATLLTLGAVAPVAVHAEEVTEATNELIQEREILNTQDNLKKHVDLSITEVQDLLKSLQESNSIFNVSTDTDINTGIDTSEAKNIGHIGINKDSNNTYVISKGLSLLFNEPSGSKRVAYNLPKLTDAQAALFSQEQENDRIITTTNIKSADYINIGDSFTITFWANNLGSTNKNDFTKLATSTIKVVEAIETQDYSVHATNINAEIGDLYNPTQNVTVKNKKDGYTISKPVVVFVNEDGNYEFFGRDQVIKSLGVNDLTSNMKEVVEKITNEFNISVGDFYLLEDTSKFANPINVKTETIQLGTNHVQTLEYYNKDIKDFDQQLKIYIPTDIKGTDTAELYANRMINVTGETEGETPEETKVPVYRAYNPNNGDHLFTTSLKEYNEVVDKGWAPEGLAWNAATEEDGTKPVYRLYNPNSGEHFYTDSEKEYNEVAAAGWNKEGIAFYSAASEDGVKIFRSFNPNATGPGSHMFTDSEKEYNELTAAGWSPEGVAFYGIK